MSSWISRSWLAVFFTVVVLPWSVAGVADDKTDWKLSKEDKGQEIVMYTRVDEDERFKSFKLVTTVDATQETMSAVLLDFTYYCMWVDRCAEVKILKKLSDTQYFIYMVHSTPPGAVTRDTVLYGRAWRDPRLPGVYIKTEARPEYLPANPSRVRMQKEDMSWYLEPIGESRIRIELTGNVDIGGKLPKAVAEIFVLQAPYNTLLGLKKMAKMERYRQPTLPDAIVRLIHPDQMPATATAASPHAGWGPPSEEEDTAAGSSGTTASAGSEAEAEAPVLP